jgi:1,4-alpha-glucan branching enzyme
MTARAGVAASAAFGVPLVFHVHLPQPSDPGLERESDGAAGADAIIVNSASVLEELAARGADASRIEVIPNGVDVDVFHPAADWPADDGSILFVGRLVPQKGVDVLIRALGALLPRHPAARLVIVGDGDSRLALQRLVRALGLGPAVTFTGWTSGAALVAAYQRAAVVVVPSRYEPFGIVALEGMACGRPVVASRVGGLSDVVNDEVGTLVPESDPLALAVALARFLGDPEARAAAGREGTARAARFGWGTVADRTLELYRRVLAMESDR